MSIAARIVIVSYNSEAHVERCLASLEATTTSPHEVVVVDNASTDNTAVIASNHKVTLLRNEANLGFAHAVNQGAAGATAPWIILVNPDTEVMPGCIDSLISFADNHPAHGIVGGHTLDAKGRPDARSAWAFPTPWSLTCYALGLSTLFPASRLFNPTVVQPGTTPQQVDAVSGCLLLISGALFERLGGMDERYFVYGEDIDLAYRAAKLGARPVIIPDAVVKHHVGGSSDKRTKDILTMRGKVTFALLNYRGLRRLGTVRAYELGILLRSIAARAVRRLRTSRRPTFWIQIWEDRDQWRGGWLEHHPAGRKESTIERPESTPGAVR